MSIETIREDGIANSNVMYCPAWSAPNKSGRPKKNERQKSVLENAGVKKVTKKTIKAMMKFCQVCHKSSHIANECWELEKNADICLVNWKLKCEKKQKLT